MATLRFRLANGEPLYICASAFRLAEEISGQLNRIEDGAQSVMLYDLMDGSGLQVARLATAAAAVADEIAHDAHFHGSLVELRSNIGYRVWALANQQLAVQGLKPPAEAEVAEVRAGVERALYAAAMLTDDDTSPEACQARQAAASLKRSLSSLEALAGARAKVNLAIPTANGAAHYAYLVEQSADEVMALFAPRSPPAGKPPRPPPATFAHDWRQ